MAANKRQNLVFLSYASEDLPKVREVYDGLLKRGLNVWFDKKNLEPAELWKPEIEKAIANCRYFVICLSEAAIKKLSKDKSGVQDSELHFAYNIAREQPVEAFGIIPVRLEDCGRGDFRLSGWQQLDLFEAFEECLDKLAIKIGGKSLLDDTAKDERVESEKLIDGLYARATTEFYTGRYKESKKLCDSVLLLAPDNADVLNSGGGALFNLGRYEEALGFCSMSLKFNPNSAMAWANSGNTLKNLNRYEEALVAYDKALEIDPDNDDVWYNKGTLLRKLGRKEAALAALTRALELKARQLEKLTRK